MSLKGHFNVSTANTAKKIMNRLLYCTIITTIRSYVCPTVPLDKTKSIV